MSVQMELPVVAEPAKPLLEPEEMAEYLSISRATLDRWSKTPGFPVIRQGKIVLFSWRQVLAYLEEVAREGRTLYSRSSTPKPRGRK